jgi:hypothetical protein
LTNQPQTVTTTNNTHFGPCVSHSRARLPQAAGLFDHRRHHHLIINGQPSATSTITTNNTATLAGAVFVFTQTGFCHLGSFRR